VRNALLAAGIVVAVGAAVATINGVVDPKDEFYSGGALTAALTSNCLLGDDVVHARSYAEFKQDLFRRRGVTRVRVGSNAGGPSSVNMSFPGFGTQSLLETMRFLGREVRDGRRLSVRITTEPSWFNTNTQPKTFNESLLSKIGYLLDPLTLTSALELVRRSRTLAFTGWRKEQVGRSCVVDRGSPSPAWRADGRYTGRPQESRNEWGGFAWTRLSALDQALAIAQQHRWRVAGVSASRGPAPYARELKALFAKHGYTWRVRRMPG
jgi:hypothetical protein